jgi:hypothetical protein
VQLDGIVALGGGGQYEHDTIRVETLEKMND